MKQAALLFFTLLFFQKTAAQPPEIRLEKGLVISENCRIAPGEYRLDGSAADVFSPPFELSAAQPVLVISGDGFAVDFQNALLRGSNDKVFPNDFYGLAILVRGKNIKISNARVRGFKVALLADGCENLILENCDFSYNYRQRLRSTREREDFADWLSHHQNENDEWLRYGAAIYLKKCTWPEVRRCRVTGGQNALMMTRCTAGKIWNNTFHFNSGLGIGLYRSFVNRLMHNKLDWNVRGYSHGVYQRGQDSAGILVYEQSHENVIAFNSATHSGDGFFLWAGQTTMDLGHGGCNDNLIYGNDFSHAPTNGIEVTFSRNNLINNRLEECTYGIWGGYSYESLIFGNQITNCKTGIAIEHGQDNVIRQNLFEDDSTGIQLWAREKQPDDWGYAKHRDTRSRDCEVDKNVFLSVRKPLKISNSENISINGENLFFDFETLLETPKPNVGSGVKFFRNDIYGTRDEIESVWQNPELAKHRSVNFSHEKDPENPMAVLEIPLDELREPDSLPGGMNTTLPRDFPRGREWIVMDEWGPYGFRRPKAWLKEILQESYDPKPLFVLYLLFPPGRWRLAKMHGVEWVSDTAGTHPIELSFLAGEDKPEDVRLDFEFVGDADFDDVFGNRIRRGETYKFDYQYFKKRIDWQVSFFNYDSLTNPLTNERAFEILKNQKPAAEKKTDDLYFAWWGSPVAGVQDDRFAVRATASLNISPGTYKIELTSDDGARLYLDGKRLFDNWDIHEPETDEAVVQLGGRHSLLVEHFEASGFSTLDFRLTPVR